MLNRTHIKEHPGLVLLVFWISYLCALGFLQLIGFKLGFKIWPLGEDRNWLGFMMNASGKGITHLSWATDHRNPLSPWWWVLIAPLLHVSDYALYAVRKLVDPLLAISIYLLLDQLSFKRARLFCFSVACITLLWNFSAYFEQIQWEFLIALSLTLLTILFYCEYVDSARKNGFKLGLSLICYFIAISTYTLQSGAIIAIFFIAFFRNDNFSSKKNAILDISYFSILFIIYNMLWYAMSPVADAFYTFDWSVFFKQFVLSIKNFIYHSSYTMFFNLVKSDWSIQIIILILTLGFSFLFILLHYIFKEKKFVTINAPIVWSAIILLSIAVPTVIVESTSALWFPGTRSVMVQQIWQPLLYVSLIFLFMNILPIKCIKTKQSLTILFVSLLGSIVILINLNYNHRLVIRTVYQRTLAKQLKRLIDPVFPTYFLVKMKDEHPDHILPNIFYYGKTMLKHKNASIRMFTTQPSPSVYSEPFWKVAFLDDQSGVKNAELVDNTGDNLVSKTVPYSQVWIVFYDGKNINIPDVINQTDLSDLQIEWRRNAPIQQKAIHRKG